MKNSLKNNPYGELRAEMIALEIGNINNTSLFFSVVYVLVNINQNGNYNGKNIMNDIFHSSVMALIVMLMMLFPFKKMKK